MVPGTPDTVAMQGKFDAPWPTLVIPARPVQRPSGPVLPVTSMPVTASLLRIGCYMLNRRRSSCSTIASAVSDASYGCKKLSMRTH